LDIADTSLKAINYFHDVKIHTIEDIMEIDKKVRVFANG